MKHITNHETYIFSVDKPETRRSELIRRRKEVKREIQKLLKALDVQGNIAETYGEFEGQREVSFLMTISKKVNSAAHLKAFRSLFEYMIFEQYGQSAYIVQDSQLDYYLVTSLNPETLETGRHTLRDRAHRVRTLTPAQFAAESPEEWTYIPHLQRYLYLDFD